PVVSTKKGAEGLDIINGKEIYIADTENSFVQMILHLFSHPEAALSAAINGRKMVESKYDWRIITKHFENLLCKNLDRSIN
ncbi:MAG: glycosyltransferase, partial [Acidobacteria bacterium]|nr:glycosyltransferase [Acidobacteriota bacterium]MBU1474578.1 glycosyltransferase [Acidobacteriota bacterium]